LGADDACGASGATGCRFYLLEVVMLATRKVFSILSTLFLISSFVPAFLPLRTAQAAAGADDACLGTAPADAYAG